ncbi:hypothetical protein M5X11_09155 [Paenibacillus alginolyticus]|uniref:hypothetical protein n=1 Tax=Paenibacillus alginolyticus TaxID=59839 RepID=UPI0004922475|nr:hypothetical protein [Paenibacillus alginolyticus]MCY9665125.1 hypothetical protein [Paenibacillus alginolyticus]
MPNKQKSKNIITRNGNDPDKASSELNNVLSNQDLINKINKSGWVVANQIIKKTQQHSPIILESQVFTNKHPSIRAEIAMVKEKKSANEKQLGNEKDILEIVDRLVHYYTDKCKNEIVRIENSLVQKLYEDRHYNRMIKFRVFLEKDGENFSVFSILYSTERTFPVVIVTSDNILSCRTKINLYTMLLEILKRQTNKIKNIKVQPSN